MKKIYVLGALTLVSGLSFAQETGRVLSATPLIQQVSVPRQVCNTQQVAVEPQRSGAGALMGGIAGGAVGNAIGGGNGRAAATVLGIFGGAILGDRIESPGPTQLQNVQSCGTQNFFENRTMGYNVVYEYAGKQYTTTLASDPGPTIALQVTPVGYGAPVRAPVQGPIMSNDYYPPSAPIGVEIRQDYRRWR